MPLGSHFSSLGLLRRAARPIDHRPGFSLDPGCIPNLVVHVKSVALVFNHLFGKDSRGPTGHSWIQKSIGDDRLLRNVKNKRGDNE